MYCFSTWPSRSWTTSRLYSWVRGQVPALQNGLGPRTDGCRTLLPVFSCCDVPPAVLARHDVVSHPFGHSRTSIARFIGDSIAPSTSHSKAKPRLTRQSGISYSPIVPINRRTSIGFSERQGAAGRVCTPWVWAPHEWGNRRRATHGVKVSRRLSNRPIRVAGTYRSIRR